MFLVADMTTLKAFNFRCQPTMLWIRSQTHRW